MFADFYIPWLSNDMKVVVQKNNLGGQTWYRSLDPVKKTAFFLGFFGKSPRNFTEKI